MISADPSTCAFARSLSSEPFFSSIEPFYEPQHYAALNVSNRPLGSGAELVDLAGAVNLPASGPKEDIELEPVVTSLETGMLMRLSRDPEVSGFFEPSEDMMKTKAGNHKRRNQRWSPDAVVAEVHK